MIKSYSDLHRIESFEDRFAYLKLGGVVGRSTFGFDRVFNQRFYTSIEWKNVRYHVIVRDNGCDLGVEGYEIHDRVLIHHMNPMRLEDLESGKDDIINPEYLITTTHNTHNAIHYGDESLLQGCRHQECLAIIFLGGRRNGGPWDKRFSAQITRQLRSRWNVFKSWIASLNLAQRNDWDARKPKVLKFMKEQLRCSAYLLQETDLGMAVYLAVGLGWSTHEGSPCWGGDKNRNFVIFDDNKFWHRETYAPALSQKKYDLADRHHRSAVWVSLIHMASGEKITLGSSHLSNGSDTGPDRELQAERLVKTLPPGPLALGIDRNSRGTSSPAKILNSAGLKDATFGLDPRRTYKSGDPRRDGVQIDAIHVRDAYLENVTLLETVGLTDHRAWRAKLVVPTPV